MWNFRPVVMKTSIREIFQIKSQPTLYKILQFTGSNVKGFLKMRGNTNQKIET